HSVNTTISSTTLVYHSVSRNRRLPKKISLRFSGRAKGITPPPDGLDQRPVEAFVQLTAQQVDVHFDDVRRPFPVRFPQVLAEHLPRHELPGMPQQEFQEAEFRRGQIDLV